LKPTTILALSLSALIALVLSGCTTAPATSAEITPGGAALVMKAGNFFFDPNTVTVKGTGTITLTITNTGGSSHNITVNDPSGKVIDSAEIPPNGTVTTQVTFPVPGEYRFTCNHPFHADLGMKGRFIVSGG